MVWTPFVGVHIRNSGLSVHQGQVHEILSELLVLLVSFAPLSLGLLHDRLRATLQVLPHVRDTQLVRQTQLGGRHPVGVVVIRDQNLRAQLFGVGLQPLPKSLAIAAFEEHLESRGLFPLCASTTKPTTTLCPLTL